MAQITLEVPDDVEVCWRALAAQAGVPLEGWIARCCTFASILGIPISEAFLAQPSVERELSGVAWEVRTHGSLEPRNGGEPIDNTVPIVDVRTAIRRKGSWTPTALAPSGPKLAVRQPTAAPSETCSCLKASL